MSSTRADFSFGTGAATNAGGGLQHLCEGRRQHPPRFSQAGARGVSERFFQGLSFCCKSKSLLAWTPGAEDVEPCGAQTSLNAKQICGRLSRHELIGTQDGVTQSTPKYVRMDLDTCLSRSFRQGGHPLHQPQPAQTCCRAERGLAS